jgi:hypothetical protein
MDSSYQDFLAYALIYAANADYEFLPEERDFILTRVSVAEYERMNELYTKHSDIESLQFLSNNAAKYLQNPKDKIKMMDEIKALFLADHEMDTLEENIWRILDDILA